MLAQVKVVQLGWTRRPSTRHVRQPGRANWVPTSAEVEVRELIVIAVLSATTVISGSRDALFSHTATAQGVGGIDQQAVGPREGRPAEMFGFRLGDERRYVMGPPGHFQPGEMESWSIRLQQIVDDPAQGERRIARFSLHYESRRFPRRGSYLGLDAIITVLAATDLWVNEHGFPLRIDYRASRSDLTPGNEHVQLVFKDDRFEVVNEHSMRFRRYELRLPSERHIDLSIPVGVFVDFGVNPGLLGLVTDILGGDGGDTSFSSFDFRPLARTDYEPPPRVSIDLSERSGQLRTRPLGPLHPHFVRRNLSFKGEGQTEVGHTTRTAVRLRVSGSRQDRWIAADGTVLRVDTRTGFLRNGWIRLLNPSEY